MHFQQRYAFYLVITPTNAHLTLQNNSLILLLHVLMSFIPSSGTFTPQILKLTKME